MPVPDEIVCRHLADLRLAGQSPGSVQARRRAIGRMARLIDAPLHKATAGDLARWRAGLRTCDNTVAHYASHARQFYGWLVREGYRPDNPARDLRVPVLARGLPRPIGEHDLIRAIAAAPGRIRIWLILAACCGLRAKEISCLTRECVLDTQARPVLIVARDATKGRREHVVPLSPFVRAELRPWLPRAGVVFGRADGRPGRNSPARVSQACNQYLHGAGIAESLHQLRHRFGTVGYATGRDLRQLQEMMGHADPATTSLYVQVCAIGAAQIVDAMPVPVALRAAA